MAQQLDLSKIPGTKESNTLDLSKIPDVDPAEIERAARIKRRQSTTLLERLTDIDVKGIQKPTSNIKAVPLSVPTEAGSLVGSLFGNIMEELRASNFVDVGRRTKTIVPKGITTRGVLPFNPFSGETTEVPISRGFKEFGVDLALDPLNLVFGAKPLVKAIKPLSKALSKFGKVEKLVKGKSIERLTRLQYDERRAKELGLTIVNPLDHPEINSNIGYAYRDGKIARGIDTNVESGSFTHELRHAIDDKLNVKKLIDPTHKSEWMSINTPWWNLKKYLFKENRALGRTYGLETKSEITEGVIDLVLRKDKDFMLKFPEVYKRVNTSELRSFEHLNIPFSDFLTNDLVKNVAGKGKKAEPIIEEFLKGKGDKEISDVLSSLGKKAREGDVDAALTKDMIKQATGKAKASPFATPTVVQKVDKALVKIKALGKEQKAIIAAGKSERVKESLRIAEGNLKGEALANARSKALSGEFDKVEFEPLKEILTGDDTEKLFDIINKSSMGEYDKAAASKALRQMLEGNRPVDSHIALLEEAFGIDMVENLAKSKNMLKRYNEFLGEAVNIPKAMRATADFSGMLRQGIYVAPRHPIIFGRASKDMFKFAFNEKAYDGFFKGLRNHPEYKLMRESDLAITNLGKDLKFREEAIMSHLPEKIPTLFGGGVIRGSNRAYTGFLNKLRVDTFTDMVNSARKQGLTVDKEFGKKIAHLTNLMTGRGNLLPTLEKVSPLLNGIGFSPRLASSRLQLIPNPFIGTLKGTNPYFSANKFIRKEAWKSFLAFVSMGGTVLSLAHISGLKVGLDPSSSDFGQIIFGNKRIDIWGGFRPYVVAASRIAQQKRTNPKTGKTTSFDDNIDFTGTNSTLGVLGSLLRSKESPAAAFVHGKFSKRTFSGDEFRTAPEAINLFIPLIAEDIKDIIQEESSVGEKVATSAWAILGGGVQVFGDQIPVKTETKTGRESIRFRQQPTIGEIISNTVTGKQVSNIPLSKHKKLLDAHNEKTQRSIKIDEAKSRVMETGKTETVGSVIIFKRNGIVKTKNRRRRR